MRLKILIPNKNRINETLKNPEKRLFLYVFCFFSHFSSTFNLLFFAFSLFSRTFADEKNKLVNQQRIQDFEILKRYTISPKRGKAILYKYKELFLIDCK